jgi:hypothetical protein
MLIGIVLIAANLFAQNSLIHHEINANVNPSASTVDVTDEITIPEVMLSEEIKFSLNSVLIMSDEVEGISVRKIKDGVKAEDIGMDREETESSNELLLNEYKIDIPENHSGDFILQINYSGIIESPIEQSEENYARGFSESPGIPLIGSLTLMII